MTYQVSAIAASCLLTSTAIVATWCRFTMHADGAIPAAEFLCTLLLIVGGTVGATRQSQFWAYLLCLDILCGSWDSDLCPLCTCSSGWHGDVRPLRSPYPMA